LTGTNQDPNEILSDFNVNPHIGASMN